MQRRWFVWFALVALALLLWPFCSAATPASKPEGTPHGGGGHLRQ